MPRPKPLRLALALACATLAPLPAGAAWNDKERAEFYHLPEGSEIFPLDWLAALTISRTHKPFLDDLERFGLIADPNGDPIYGAPGKRLPIGLTAAKPRGLSLTMVGVNCAACHVGQVAHRGKALTVDGAPNLFDIEGLYQEIFRSVEATLRDRKELVAFLERLAKAKPHDKPTELLVALLPALKKGGAVEGLEGALLARLRRLLGAADEGAVADYLHLAAAAGGTEARAVAQRLLSDERKRLDREGAALGALRKALGKGPKPGDGKVAKLLLELGPERLALLEARFVFLRRLKDLHAPGQPQFPPGPGRIDAFTNARNLIFGGKDSIPASSPVRYPHLWGLGKLDWLHWDGNTNSIMERNIGQALGLGAIAVPATGQSTVLPRNLHRLELLAKKIEAPAWPEAHFKLRPVVPAKVKRGQKLYATHCASCHDKPGGEVFPADKVGTDPERANNFARPMAGGAPFAKALADQLSKIKKRAFQDAKVSAKERTDMDVKNVVWRTTRGYAARPLAGIWAKPPYLHNGSVPTLDDLLKPAAQRPRIFPVGHREYDFDKLGYVSDPAQVPKEQLGRVFYFDIRQLGNGNGGHEYGAEELKGEEDRQALLEYLKTL
jgi:mono/diheme cytochrome c family protein